jgi:hypothetical protein
VSRGRLVARAIAAVAVGAVAASAQSAPARAASGTVDRVAVRYFAPETGGSSHPRFLSERELAFESRLEALGEQAPASSAYQDRFVRAALDRHVAEDMLSALQVQQGTEPPDLPARAEAERIGLMERSGGPAALRDAMAAEGFEDAELDALLRRRVRAAYYVDRALTPILHPTEEQLREVQRTSANPYKAMPFDEVRPALARWFIEGRLRIAETTFLQAARARVRVVVVGRPDGGTAKPAEAR